MAKTKIDKDDIKRLVENTSNPTSTTSVYSAKYVEENFATSTDVQTAVASVYKLKGNIADKTALLALTNVKQGDVYNAQNAFTLIDGQNVQNVKIGDNIVCLSDADTSEDANWDNLSGNIDYDDLGDMPVATDTEVGGIMIGHTPGNDGAIPLQLWGNKAYIQLLAKHIRHAMEYDTNNSGKRYWLKNKTIIIPDDSLDDGYSEGLRIANTPYGWSTIALGTENTLSGLNTDGNQWNIVKRPNGTLTISFDDGFDDDGYRTGLALYNDGDGGGDIYWKNTKLNLPRVSPLVSGWLHAEDFISFSRVADHAQITLISEELKFSEGQNYIGGHEIFVDSPDFVLSNEDGLYNGSGGYNLVSHRRYEVIINMGMNIPKTGGLITLQLEEESAVTKRTSTTANVGNLSMSLSCIVSGGGKVAVSIQKDAGIDLNLLQYQCWFAVHEIK